MGIKEREREREEGTWGDKDDEGDDDGDELCVQLEIHERLRVCVRQAASHPSAPLFLFQQLLLFAYIYYCSTNELRNVLSVL